MTKSREANTNLALDFGADDDGNSEVMLALYPDRMLYNRSLGWLEYDGKHYKEVSDERVKLLALEALLKRHELAIGREEYKSLFNATKPNRDKVNDAVFLYRAKVTVENLGAFDSNPDLLNTQNGLVNLRTGSIADHAPCQMQTYVANIPYNRDADTAQWHNFIHAVIPSEATVHFIQRALGYSITGRMDYKYIFYGFGPKDSGKSTFQNAIMGLLPDQIITTRQYDTFVGKRDPDTQNFDLAGLRTARSVFVAEGNRRQFDIGKLKQLSGGDPITAAHKFQKDFTYYPKFKLWFISNYMVPADAYDEAMWRRIIVIDFPFSHTGNENFELGRIFQQPEVQEGILKWVVDGAMLTYQEGKLSPPDEITLSTKHHRENQNDVEQWIEDSCMLDETAFSSAKALRASYIQYCKDMGIHPVSPQQLSRVLVEQYKCIRKLRGHKNTRVYFGITLKENSEFDASAASEAFEGELASPIAPEPATVLTSSTLLSLRSEENEYRDIRGNISRGEENHRSDRVARASSDRTEKPQQNGHIKEWVIGTDLPVCPECGDACEVVFNNLQGTVYCRKHAHAMQVIVLEEMMK